MTRKGTCWVFPCPCMGICRADAVLDARLPLARDVAAKGVSFDQCALAYQ